MKLTITMARSICEAAGAKQVVVLAFDGDNYACVSYGATKALCAAVRPVCDEISDRINGGSLSLVPWPARAATPPEPTP